MKRRSRSVTRLRLSYGPADVVLAALRLADVAVHRRERRMRHREVRIELNGALEERDRFDVGAGRAPGEAKRVGAQRIERRGRDLLDRQIELFQRRKRFAEPRPHRGRQVSERLQHAFAALGVDLFLHEHVAAAGTPPRSASRRRAGRAASTDPSMTAAAAEPLAHFERDFTRQPLIAWTVPEPQRIGQSARQAGCRETATARVERRAPDATSRRTPGRRVLFAISPRMIESFSVSGAGDCRDAASSRHVADDAERHGGEHRREQDGPAAPAAVAPPAAPACPTPAHA